MKKSTDCGESQPHGYIYTIAPASTAQGKLWEEGGRFQEHLNMEEEKSLRVPLVDKKLPTINDSWEKEN